MEQHDFWQKMESTLRNYEAAYSAERWFRDWGGLTRKRKGYFIFLRLAFLIGLYIAAFYMPLQAWLKVFLSIIAIYLIADMFMLPTSYAFGGIPHVLPLRALFYVFLNYVSICIAFGLLYLILCRLSFNVDPDLIDLAYFSFTTITGLGIGDISPLRHTILVKFLIVSELLIGLYFWAVLVGMIISWRVKEVKSGKSLPK
jgi:hypothetical protein